MKNSALAPMLLLLALLALAWGGIFGLSQVTANKDARTASAPTPSPTTTPRSTVGAGSDRSDSKPSSAETFTDRVAESTRPGERTTTRGTTGTNGARYGRSGEDATADQAGSRQDSSPAPHEVYTAPADSPAGRDALAGGAAAGDSSTGDGGGLDGLVDRFTSHDTSTDTAREPGGLSTRGAAALIIVLLLVAAGSSRRG